MSTLLKRILTIQGATFFLALGALLVLPVMATAAETPRAGGELVFAVGETPPSFDGHRETTFGMLHPIAVSYTQLTLPTKRIV
jgi:hypothetical protein